jgi:autotransporter-associated beta strand protein
MSTWNALGSGNWATSANWIGGVPDSVSAIADLTVLAGAAINHLIDLQALSRTVHELDMRSSSLERFTVTHGTLVFDGVGNAVVKVNSTGAGTPLSSVIGANVSLFLNVDTNITVASGSTFDVLAQIYGVGQLLKFGAGTMRVGNTDSNRISATDIRGGTLEMVNGTALGHGAILIGDGTLRATATTTLVNDVTTSVNAHSTILAASGTVTTLTGGFAIANGAAGSLHFGSDVDNGTIVFATSISNSVDTSGQVFIDGGTLQDGSPYLSGMLALLAGTNIAAGATLDIFGHDVTINHLGGAGTITNGGAIAVNSVLTLVENGIGTFSGDFAQGTHDVIIHKEGAGTLILSGTSTMQGSFAVENGTLQTNASGVFGSGGNPFDLFVSTGATVDLNGFDQSVRNLEGGGQILGHGGGSPVVLIIGQGTQVNDGSIFSGYLGNGTSVLAELAIVKAGLGEVFLSGTSDYTGDTLITSGTLSLLLTGSIASSRFVDVGGAGTFDISNSSGAGAAVQALHNIGSVNVAGKMLQMIDQDVDLKAAFKGSALVEGITVNMATFLADFSAASATFTTWTDATDSISINGNALANKMTGTSHADILYGASGNDVLDGGAGSDTAHYGDKLSAVVVTLNGATAVTVKVGGVVEDTIKNIENLIGGNAGDTLTGDALANTLNGGIDAVADTLTGKAGNDTYVINNATDNIIELVGEGTADRAIVNVSYTLGVGDNIEFLETTNAAATTAINLKGNEIGQTITGNAANNTITGGGGLDHMVGGDGSDIYFADLASDVVIETNNSFAVGGNDLVNFTGSAGTFVLGANVERLTLQGAAAINGIGNALSNILTGNSAANTLSGLGGYDIINGGGGLDHMTGGDGSDTFYADLSTDVVTESNAVLATGGDDLVYFNGASGAFKLGANVERLTLQGVSAIDGTGNGLANTIIGNSAANVINGGLGNDVLTGGLGNDTFRFDTLLAANIDSITDFNVAADTMQLENAIFTGLTAGAVILAGQFHDITAAAQDVDDKILYNHTTGDLIFDSNGLTAGGQTVFAHVTANTALTNLDFFVT